MNNPLRLRRLGLLLVIAGAVLGGLGDGIRANAETGEANWTFLLDVVGLLLALGGAVCEARSSEPFFAFSPTPARRRALIRFVAGLLAMLLACVLTSAVEQPIARGLVGAVLIGGVGIGAGGLFTLAWHYGGSYAANRIQDRIDDDWR